MIKLLLVDDQPAVLRGLRMRLALEPDMTVAGEADDGAAALALVATVRPDVVVMDAVMPGLDGLAATTALRTLSPRTAVIILSMYDDAGVRGRAGLVGAVAFVSKGEALEALLDAIRRAMDGHAA
jgi:DNA-binding NarL/FixJ family response regulator